MITWKQKQWKKHTPWQLGPWSSSIFSSPFNGWSTRRLIAWYHEKPDLVRGGSGEQELLCAIWSFVSPDRFREKDIPRDVWRPRKCLTLPMNWDDSGWGWPGKSVCWEVCTRFHPDHKGTSIGEPRFRKQSDGKFGTSPVRNPYYQWMMFQPIFDSVMLDYPQGTGSLFHLEVFCI